MLSEKIKELRSCQLNCNVFSVYDYPGYSIQELLCQFFTKINECIEISNKTIDLAEWLVNEGLEKEVAKKLEIWLEDGTLASLINDTLLKEINEKVNNKVDKKDMPSSCIEYYGAKGDGVTDDTQAFINAFKNSKSVYLLNSKRYLISNKILMSEYSTLDGYNSTIIYSTPESNIILNKGCTVKNLHTEVETNIELSEAVFTIDGNLQYNVGFVDTPNIFNVTGEQKYNDGQKRSTFIHLKGEQENPFRQCYISGTSLQNLKCIRFKYGVKTTCKEVPDTNYKTYVTSTQLNNFHAFNCENFIYEFDAVGKKASIGGNIYTNCHFQPIDNGFHIFLYNTGNGNIIRDCDFWDNSRCVNDDQIIIKSNNNVISGGKIPPFDSKYWKIEGDYNFITGHTYGTPSSFIPVVIGDKNIYRLFKNSKKSTPFLNSVSSLEKKSGIAESSINEINLNIDEIREGHNVIKIKNFGTGKGTSDKTIDFILKINNNPLINGNMSNIYSNSYKVDVLIDIRKYKDYTEIKAIMESTIASGKSYIFSGISNIQHSNTKDLNISLNFKSDEEGYLTNIYSESEMVTP